jgi:hypothetical protein
MKRARTCEDRSMTHLMNALCASVLVYASVTRGGLAVARGIEYVVRRAG